MAAMLTVQYQLTVVRVELKVQGGRQTVHLRIFRYQGGGTQLFGRWTLDFPASPDGEEFPEAGTAPSGQGFDLCALLRAHMSEMATQLQAAVNVSEPPESPLWLHLVKPYGWLGGLPWEAGLEPIFDRPVVRLPDFLDMPPENDSSFDAAVVLDVRGTNADIVKATEVVQALLAGSPRTQGQIYVFGRGPVVRAVKRQFASERRLWTAPAVKSPSDRGVAWLDDVARVLAGRSIDHLHVVGSATLTVAGPSLVLADPAAGPDAPAKLSFCSPAAFAQTLTRLGAWSAGFTPAEGSDQNRLRQFADALAQARPGTVLFAPQAEALKSVTAFLFSPQPRFPPRFGQAMVYCHPQLVPESAQGQSWEGTPALKNAHLFSAQTSYAVNPSLGQRLSSLLGATPPAQSSANTPLWVAASQRFVETAIMDNVRSSGEDALQPTDLTAAGAPMKLGGIWRHDTARAVTETLDQIQEIVAQYANPSVMSGE